MSDNTYITLRQDEKQVLDKWIKQYYGSTSRISRGAAIRTLAESEVEE
jgi:hypothetical protein